MSDIKLSPSQAKAVDSIGHWLHHSPSQVYVLGGYAGTGKTTIMAEVEAMSGISSHFCAPTGKAVSVLKSKLRDGASISTVHSFVYRPSEVTVGQVEAAEKHAVELVEASATDPTLTEEAVNAVLRAEELARILEAGSAEFFEKVSEDGPVPLVIVDEASMVDDDMERLILRNAGKVLFVGDPGQLPPVNGKSIFERHQADTVLEEIHRQAGESSILQFAHAVRNDEAFDGWVPGVCEKVKGRPPLRDVVAADQVITGKNATRTGLNGAIRRHLGFDARYPMKGEKLMCLRNDHARGLINGVGGVTTADAHETALGELYLDLAYNGQQMDRLMADTFHFDAYVDTNQSRRDRPPREAQFDFGYTITCHKSQGSEWPHVVVWDDKMRVRDRPSRRRWAYTAITRAAERLTWVDA